MKTIYTLILLCLATIGYSQEVTRKIEPFTSIIASRGVDITLVKSNSDEITIRTNGIDPEDVITEGRNDELVIKVATKSLWQEMQDNRWWARIEVPYKVIENLEVSTGARIKSEELLAGKVLDGQVSMGGELVLEVQLEELNIDSSMGGIADLTGRAVRVELSASMGAEIDLRELKADVVHAKSSMGAEVKVHAIKEFDGRANMGGYIRVSGDPDKFYVSTSMGGDISSNK